MEYVTAGKPECNQIRFLQQLEFQLEFLFKWILGCSCIHCNKQWIIQHTDGLNNIILTSFFETSGGIRCLVYESMI